MLIVIPIFSLLIMIFFLSKNYLVLILGIIIWGIVMGTHETIMKSGIADLSHFKKRGSAYGIFNTFYGLAILFGTSLISFLYKFSINYVIIFVVFMELLAILLYLLLLKEIKRYN